MVKADKSFGQHFLINEGIVQKIVDSVDRQCQKLANRTVIEIGPGPGALTQALLAKKMNVIAVELDRRMIDSLEAKFRPELAAGSLTLVQGDAATLKAETFAALNPAVASELNKPYVLCGNLPYNVGTAIVFNALENLSLAEAFCFMLQKEVVQRLKSEPGSKSYGIPSIKFAWSVDVLDHFWVSPGSFSPPPKVESGVIVYRRKSAAHLLADPRERKGLYDQTSGLVNRLFQNRRKMIGSTAKELRDNEVARKRPEELQPSEFIALARLIAESPPKIG